MKGDDRKSRGAKKLCFVIMPFSGIRGICTQEDWSTIFEGLFKPTVQDAGYECRRSDPTTGNIIRDIINDLANADVVMADLTGQNPNVFYELGVRHATRGRSILIAQHERYIPSDLRSYAYHIYDWRSREGKREFRSKIQSLLVQLDADTNRTDNSVEDFLHLTPEREIVRLSAQPTSDIQRGALQNAIANCVVTLRKIHDGQIPIEGGAPGYFATLLDLIENSDPGQKIKVFVNLIPLEIGERDGDALEM